LQILSQQPLLLATDRVLRRLLEGLGASQSKARQAVMKAVSELVASDAALMREAYVKRAVERLLADDSKLVRAEAVELVGRHVLAAPRALLPSYYEMLLGKLHDSGISTRKRVVGIFRDLVARHMLEDDGQARAAAARFSGTAGAAAAAAGAPGAPAQDLMRPLLLPPDAAQQTQVLRALLERASDRHEEDSVKDAVAEAFQTFWFAPPSAEALEAAGGASAGERVLAEVAARTAQVLAVVDGAIFVEERGTDWLVDMLRRIAGGDLIVLDDGAPQTAAQAAQAAHAAASGLSGSAATKREAAKQKKVSAALNSSALALHLPGVGPWCPANVCAAMVDTLVRALLALGERRMAVLMAREAPAPGEDAQPGSGGAGAGAAGFKASSVGSRSPDASRPSSPTASHRDATAEGVVGSGGAGAAIAGSGGAGGAAGSGAGSGGRTAALALAQAASTAAQRVFERELVSVATALHAFAQAAPQALAKHVTTLAPYLKGEPLLSGRGSVQMLQRVAGAIEVAMPVAAGLPRSTTAAVERDLLALMFRGRPQVMQASAAALGVLVSAVTGNDASVRAVVQRMYGHLRSLQAKLVAMTREQQEQRGTPLNADDAKVVWIRNLTSHVRGPPGDARATELVADPHYREALVSLYGLGLLVKFCDLDHAGAGGAAAAEVAEDEDELELELEEVVDEDEEDEEEAAGSKRKRGASRKPAAKQPKAARGKARAGSAAPTGLLGKLGLTGLSPSAPTFVKIAAKAPKAAKGAAGGGAGGGAGAGAGPFQLQRGEIAQRVYDVLLEWATAALVVSRAAFAQVAKLQRQIAALEARSEDEDMSPADAASSSAARDAAEGAQDRARRFLSGLEAVAVKALRGLGFACARSPRLMLSDGFRRLLAAGFAHPLWQVREAVLLMLRDLLLTLEGTSAVGRALAARAQLEQRRATALMAQGHASSGDLLASAAGKAIKAAMMSRGRKASPLAAAAAASSSSSSSAAAGSAADDRVAVTLQDGTVIMGRRGVLGDADSEASVMTGVVQENMDAVRELLFYEPSERDKEAGVADEHESGERVRGAAIALLAVVVRQGVTSPDALVHCLVAMSTDDKEEIAAQAHAQLLELSEKYSARVELHALAGVVESYWFQMRVYGSATVRVASGYTGLLGHAMLGKFYAQCIARNPLMDAGAPLLRSRLQLLRKIVLKAVPDDIPGLASSGGEGEGGAAPGSAYAAARMGATPGAAPGDGAGGGLLMRLSLSKTPGAKGASAAAAGAVGKTPGSITSLASLANAGVSASASSSSSAKTPAAQAAAAAAAASAVAATAAAVDPGLQRYLTQTLMYLPYEREDDVLTVAAFVNRQVSLHADALLAALAEYIPDADADAGAGAGAGAGAAAGAGAGAGADAGEGGGARALPAAGSLAHAHLAVHCAYAWELRLLLHAKVFLKALYGIKDERVAGFDPNAAAAAAAGADRAASALASVLGNEQQLLPPTPPQIAQALEDARAAAQARAKAAAAAGGATPGAPGAGAAAAAAAGEAVALFGSRGLSVELLRLVSRQLDAAVTESAADVSATLPMASRRRSAALAKSGKRKAAKELAAAAAAAAAGADGSASEPGGAPRRQGAAAKKPRAAKKRGKKAAGKRGQDEGEDEDDATVTTDSAVGEGAGAQRRSGRAKARASYVAADDEEGEGEE